jgi:membrane dipeptidase
MSMKKGYKNYKPYSYLEAGKDYRDFEMGPELDRVPEYLIPLSQDEEKRVEKIAKEVICISLHDHPVNFPKDLSKDLFDYNRDGRHRTAYEGLAHSYFDCIFDNLMDGTCTITSKGGWKWQDILFDLGMRLCDIAHQDFVIKCEKVEDIHRAFKEDRVALIPVVEGAAPIENELDRIEILYGFGVRLFGITYSESNGLGSGLKEKRDGGLTAFGEKAVERMNKVGMAIDCSHVGIRTTLDVIEASIHPIFLSHVGAKALWDSKRLAPDEVLQQCAKKGGVIGIEAAPHTTLTQDNTIHSVYSYMEHFKYVKNLVGIDHVAFGPDTLYGDHVGLHHAFAAHLSTKGTQGAQDFQEVPYVKGMENPTECSKNIIRWLVKNQYSDEDIEKVLSGNILRVLKQVWK